MMNGRLLVACSFVFLAAAMTQSISDAQQAEDLTTKIASAKTAADHEAIATYYDAAAKEAKQRADEHAKMGEAYKKLGGALVGKLQLDKHCASLVKSAQSEAAEYESLAQAHREMAKTAQK
jgi:hypothetical protein